VVRRASRRGDLLILAVVVPLAFVAGALVYSRVRAPARGPDGAGESAREGEGEGEQAPDVAARLRDLGPELHACYQQALQADAALGEGEILVRLEVASSGAVKGATIETALASATLDRCVRERAARWSFPAAAEGYGVQFPVAFKR
jgi:TonB family protein